MPNKFVERFVSRAKGTTKKAPGEGISSPQSRTDKSAQSVAQPVVQSVVHQSTSKSVRVPSPPRRTRADELYGAQRKPDRNQGDGQRRAGTAYINAFVDRGLRESKDRGEVLRKGKIPTRESVGFGDHVIHKGRKRPGVKLIRKKANRLTFSLTDQVRKILEIVSGKMGVTKSEAVNFAIFQAFERNVDWK